MVIIVLKEAQSAIYGLRAGDKLSPLPRPLCLHTAGKANCQFGFFTSVQSVDSGYYSVQCAYLVAS